MINKNQRKIENEDWTKKRKFSEWGNIERKGKKQDDWIDI